MERRQLLRTLGLLGVGATLGACAGSDEVAGTGGPSAAPGGAGPSAAASPAVFDPVGEVTDAEEVLTVAAATFEQLVGEDVPFAFGVRDVDNAPVEVPELTVWVTPVDGEPAGPFTAAPVDDPTGIGGLYLADLAFVQPGPTSIVAVTPDEARAGAATIPVSTPADSAFPAPGDAAPVTPTPTEAAPLGAATICTQNPPCEMHEVSLDEALEAGRPVVVTFATPAYCQTAVCGPSVAVLDEVRRRHDWGDTAFIHCEIYADEGQTLLEPVAEWQLQSEPWLYTIDATGTIVRRSDGPLLTIPEQVTALVASATAPEASPSS